MIPSEALIYRKISVVLAALLAFSCTEDIYQTQSLHPPFTRVLIHGVDSSGKRTSDETEIFVRVDADYEIKRLCNLDPFGALKPGVTHVEVEEDLGHYSRIYREAGGRDTVYVFEQPGGLLEVVQQTVYSSDGADRYQRWFLRWQPHDQRLEYHLSYELVELLKSYDLGDRYSTKVVSGEESVSILVQNSKIEAITYLVARSPDDGAADDDSRLSQGT